MVSRKQAFAFFLGALLLIYGLFLLISSVLEIHPIPVLIFGVFFLLLGRQVVIERYEAFSSHRSKLIFSSISAVIIILLSFLIVYFKNKEYPESVEWAGLGEVLLCLFAAHLILVINILLWFIVLIISWISGWLSAFGEARKKTEKEGWMVNHPGYESFSIELTKPEVPSTMIRWTTYAQNDVDGMNNG